MRVLTGSVLLAGVLFPPHSSPYQHGALCVLMASSSGKRALPSPDVILLHATVKLEAAVACSSAERSATAVLEAARLFFTFVPFFFRHKRTRLCWKRNAAGTWAPIFL